MHFGIDVPNFGDFADPATVVALARDAEAAGWDGFYVWDHINPWPDGALPVADPWVLLAAVAAATERVRIGPLVTPLPRRRPWVVARETVTLDRLSGGRLVLGVGLGIPAETEYEAFGEDGSLRARATKLDEGLAVLAGLWAGQPFEHRGEHYQVARTTFAPPPVQVPRIPIWVAGTWPTAGPLRRAARWDGYFPLKLRPDGEADPITPEDVRTMRQRIADLRETEAAFEIVTAEEPQDTGKPDLGRLRELDAAGLSWFLDGPARGQTLEATFDRVRRGPPLL